MTPTRAILRPYQQALKTSILRAWATGAMNVLAVLPTGAGKTVIFSDIIHDHDGPSVAIAHRQELVTQISLALARDQVRHRIIGPPSVVRLCVKTHMQEVGVSWYDPNARCAVAGVDTLIRRGESIRSWAQSVTLWVQDEAHHVIGGKKPNKWGKASLLFPNARGLGVTATPLRADGKGLGRHADGVFDIMIEGPGMRDLITAGYLTDYRVFAPPSDIDLAAVTVSDTTGEYNHEKLVIAVRRSHVVGDVVEHYKRIAPGKLGVTFATDVQTATDITAQFNASGIPAAVVSAKTPDSERVATVQRFRRRDLLQLVNVDIFGEGFDLPAIEVVSMARPTQSYTLYGQQFGRSLRPMEGKTAAIVIDHVGNVIRHGLPDAPRRWTLDRREKRSNGAAGGIPARSCPQCTAVYARIYRACPYCGYVTIPGSRSGPEHVDGDLLELDAETLARMRGQMDIVNLSSEAFAQRMVQRGVPEGLARDTHAKRHREQQEPQVALRDTIALWAGHRVAEGTPDSESYRRFWFAFGTDVMTACTLNAADATVLDARIREEM